MCVYEEMSTKYTEDTEKELGCSVTSFGVFSGPTNNRNDSDEFATDILIVSPPFLGFMPLS